MSKQYHMDILNKKGKTWTRINKRDKCSKQRRHGATSEHEPHYPRERKKQYRKARDMMKVDDNP